jgi:hypothetical protein
VQHRGCITSSWLLLALLFPAGAVSGQAAPGPVQVTRGPYLQNLLQSSVDILWLTDGPSLGKVRFSPDGGAASTVEESEPSLAHQISLSGLSPGTVHGYQVLDGDRILTPDPYRFRTSPRPGEGSIRAAVIGDSGAGTVHQFAVAALVKSMAPDIFIHTGDMNYLSDMDSVVFQPYHDILASACLYPTVGNHDEALDWEEFFQPPTGGNAIRYSYDWGSGHFVSLDTNENFQDQDQLDWLVADLTQARAAGAAWIILYFHKPLFTVGNKVFEASILRPAMTPILDRFGVDLVLNGHDHNYQRSHPVRGGVVHDAWQSPGFVSPRGTIDVVTGGGGQALYPENLGADHSFSAVFIEAYHALQLDLTAERLSVKAVSPDGTLLDQFSITKVGPRPALSYLHADADLNGTLQLTDAIFLLSYLYFGGETPGCPPAADANGTGLPLDLTDAVYLLNYLFTGGPPPVSPVPGCDSRQEIDDSFCTRGGCR